MSASRGGVPGRAIRWIAECSSGCLSAFAAWAALPGELFRCNAETEDGGASSTSTNALTISA